jgi:hypothetical protein
MGQANLKAVTRSAIGRWKGRSGTNRQPLPIRTKQEDACKHITSAHLLDSPEMPVEYVLKAISALELGGNFAAAILQ